MIQKYNSEAERHSNKEHVACGTMGMYLIPHALHSGRATTVPKLLMLDSRKWALEVLLEVNIKAQGSDAERNFNLT